MKKWYVDISTEDDSGGGRDIVLEIEATNGKEAIRAALDQANLKEDELLHTLFVHIGRPSQ